MEWPWSVDSGVDEHRGVGFSEPQAAHTAHYPFTRLVRSACLECLVPGRCSVGSWWTSQTQSCPQTLRCSVGPGRVLGKGLDREYSGFVGHSVSVAATQLCCPVVKVATMSK